MHIISSDERRALDAKLLPHRTTQIFSIFIGGFDELNQFNQQGKLTLLAG